MLTHLRNLFLAGLVGLLVACSGGGGGNSAQGVEPGPPPPGQPVPPDPEFPETNPSPYAEAEELFATITSVSLDSEQRAIVEWLLTDGDNVPIIDLGSRDVRFTIAKLMAIAPPGTIDPTPALYNQTMYLMAFLLFIALVANGLMRPVHPKHHMAEESG